MTAGYRHHVTAVRHRGVEAIRRVELESPDEMDMRLFSEEDILVLCRAGGIPAPRILAIDPVAGVQILERLPGESLQVRHPRGSPLPAAVIGELVNVLRRLWSIRGDQLPALRSAWPRDGDASGFLGLRIDHTARLLAAHAHQHGRRFAAFGVSDAELARISERLPLSCCAFALCHGDLNRSNMLWDGRTLSIIDWELAMFGDPAFDVAVHLHRSGYTTQDEAQLVGLLRYANPASIRADALQAHRDHERFRSLLVDAVRYRAQGLAARRDAALLRKLSERYLAKLREGAGPGSEMSATEVSRILFS